jgi:hypothetical protein
VLDAHNYKDFAPTERFSGACKHKKCPLNRQPQQRGLAGPQQVLLVRAQDCGSLHALHNGQATQKHVSHFSKISGISLWQKDGDPETC